MKRPICARIFKRLFPERACWRHAAVLGIFLGLLSIRLCAQTADSAAARGFSKDRLFVGGSLGLSVGTFTYLGLNPLLGYRFNEVFAAGLALNAQYDAARYYQANNSVSERDHYGLLGLGVFGRIYPIPELFIHVQPEWDASFGKSIFYDGSPSQRYQGQTGSLLLGGGYSRPVGKKSEATLMLLYDVLQNPGSPYGNQPLLRAGIDIGL